MTLFASIALAGGTAFGNGCVNTVASVPWCGGLLTWCTPTDQINLLYPLLEVPDYSTDPSCTVPYGCDTGDLFVPGATPGGDAPDQPTDNQGGGASSGG